MTPKGDFYPTLKQKWGQFLLTIDYRTLISKQAAEVPDYMYAMLQYDRMRSLWHTCSNDITMTSLNYICTRERGGSVVECLTRDRRAAGSSLTGVTALCP